MFGSWQHARARKNDSLKKVVVASWTCYIFMFASLCAAFLQFVYQLLNPRNRWLSVSCIVNALQLVSVDETSRKQHSDSRTTILVSVDRLHNFTHLTICTVSHTKDDGFGTLPHDTTKHSQHKNPNYSDSLTAPQQPNIQDHVPTQALCIQIQAPVS